MRTVAFPTTNDSTSQLSIVSSSSTVVSQPLLRIQQLTVIWKVFRMSSKKNEEWNSRCCQILKWCSQKYKSWLSPYLSNFSSVKFPFSGIRQCSPFFPFLKLWNLDERGFISHEYNNALSSSRFWSCCCRCYGILTNVDSFLRNTAMLGILTNVDSFLRNTTMLSVLPVSEDQTASCCRCRHAVVEDEDEDSQTRKHDSPHLEFDEARFPNQLMAVSVVVNSCAWRWNSQTRKHDWNSMKPDSRISW